MSTVFTGDVGTVISLDCGENIATATLMKIKVRKSNGQKVTWDATLDGANAIKYVTGVGDLDVPGTWHLQAYVEMPTWRGSGEVALLVIGRPI